MYATAARAQDSDAKGNLDCSRPRSFLFISLLVALFFLSPTSLYAQVMEYSITKQFGASNRTTSVTGIITDLNGNVYITGNFDETVNFAQDFGGNDNQVSNGGSDVFLTRINADGSYGWTKTFGGPGNDTGEQIAIDPSGIIFLSGNFCLTVNFAAAFGGSDVKTASSSDIGMDGFITRINADGSYGWTKIITGLVTGVYDIALDVDGDILCTGIFNTGSTNFAQDFGGTDIKTISGWRSPFITAIHPDGTYGWTRIIPADDHASGNRIVIDSSGNIYLTGWFIGRVNFAADFGGTQIINLSPEDVHSYVLKINANLTYGWTKAIWQINNNQPRGIALDPDGNVIASGYYYGGLLDPKEVFVTSLNPSGTTLWIRTLGGPGREYCQDVIADWDGNIYFTGYFRDSVNFAEPFGGNDVKTSQGDHDIFLTRINSDQTYAWTRTLGGISTDMAYSLAYDMSGNVFLGGNFKADATFGNEIKTAHGIQDGFITRFNQVDDLDHDGLADHYESAGSCPFLGNSDSDNDGLCDGSFSVPGVCLAGEEVDGDGVVDSGESGPCNPDSDGDGWVDGIDCAKLDPNHWSDCGICIDNDNDTVCGNSDVGADCDDHADTGAACSTGCQTLYLDNDSDGYGASAQLRCLMPATGLVTNNTDCNDANPNTWDTCAFCTDTDYDGWYSGCNQYVTFSGPDCDDLNPNTWNTCATCTDTDGDNWFFGCDQYASVAGPDCEPLNLWHWNDCATCLDSDNDSAFAGCNSFMDLNGPDCNDDNARAWNTCVTCADNDSDSWYGVCNNYTGINGPDCNDANPQIWSACATCMDTDADGWYGVCDQYPTQAMINVGTGADTSEYPLTTGYQEARLQVIYPASELGPRGILTSLALDVTMLPGTTLNNFTIRLKHTSLSSYTINSWEGPASGWTTVYQANPKISATGWVTFTFTTPFYYNGSDNLMIDFSFDNSANSSYGYVRFTDVPARSLSYSANGQFGDPLTWSGTSSPAPTLINQVPNLRLDFRYLIKGPDCDDANPNAWDTCATCLDTDADTWFAGCNRYVSLNGPDCAPTDPAHFNDCGGCIDADGDQHGYGCAQGLDCDDANPIVWDTCDTCFDRDGDGRYGSLCNAPDDCNDLNTNIWDTCATCMDADGDAWYGVCNAYLGINGPDCNDSNPYTWDTCATCVDNDGDTWLGSCNRYFIGTQGAVAAIGAGTNSTDLLFSTHYHDSRLQTIYLASEIGQTGAITALSLDVTAIPGQVMNNFTIRMKHTNLSSHSPLSWEGPTSGWTTVYQANQVPGVVGWQTIILTTPFIYYGGNSNLMIDISFNNNNGSTAGAVRYTSVAANRSINFRANSTYGNPLAWSGSSNPTPSGWSGIPNLRLTFGGSPINGPDCNDANPNTWNTCDTCVDTDNDTWYKRCNNYTGISGPDCNDANPNTWDTCATCLDSDADTWFDICNAYAGINGPDCNDANARTWDTCATCLDTDADTWWVGCNQYPDGKGPDCATTDPLHWNDCGICVDSDSDARGLNCNSGSDCNDANTNVWDTCASCADGDSDTWYVNCNRYLTINGPDCNDTNTRTWNTCAACLDTDADAWWAGCNQYPDGKGPDCNNSNARTWDTCATCLDTDADT